MVFDAKQNIMYNVQPDRTSYLEVALEGLAEGMGKAMEDTRTGKTDLHMDALMEQFGDAIKKQGEGSRTGLDRGPIPGRRTLKTSCRENRARLGFEPR